MCCGAGLLGCPGQPPQEEVGCWLRWWGSDWEGAYRVGGVVACTVVSDTDSRPAGRVSSLSPSHRIALLPAPEPGMARRSVPGRTGAGTALSSKDVAGRVNGESMSSAAPRRARPACPLRVSSTPSGWALSAEKALRGRCLPESVMFTSTRMTNRHQGGISLVQGTHDFGDLLDQGRRLVWRNAVLGIG